MASEIEMGSGLTTLHEGYLLAINFKSLTSVATKGKPHAKASLTELGQPSWVDVHRTKLHEETKSGISV